MGTRAGHRRAGWRLAIVLLLAAALAGCEIFTASPFPDYVGSVAADTSVSAWYDGERGEVFMTAAADIGRNRLFLSIPGGPAGDRMLVYDRNLALEKNWTLSEINGEIGGSGSLGSRAGFGPAFQPVVGSFFFDTSGGTVTPAFDTSAVAGVIADPFSEVTGRPDETGDRRFYAFTVNNMADPTELVIDSYDISLSLQMSESAAYQIDGSDEDYRLLQALPLYDGTVDGSDMLFLFGNRDRKLVYLVSIPYADLPPDDDPTSPILDNYEAFDIPNVDASRGFLTADGIIVVDEAEDELILHSFDDDELGRYDVGNAGEMELAVPLDDEGFYMLDQRRERLYYVLNFWE